eukprot:952742-Pyramimonas_sp.AAC.1
MRQLVLVKRAMRTVSKGMRRAEDEARADGTDDQLGWVLSFVRAAESVNITGMRRCAKACPAICGYVNSEDPEASAKPGFWQLKSRA